MIVLFVAIGAAVFASVVFIRATFKVLKGVVYWCVLTWFASDDVVNEVYNKKVVSTSPEYKAHNDAVDNAVNDILKD